MPESADDLLANMNEAQILTEIAGEPAEVLARLGAGLAAEGEGGPSADEFARALASREDVGSTALGKGVALPHCRLPGLERARLAVARSRAGVGFGAPDGAPVHLFIALATPAERPGAHLQLLSDLARRLRGNDRVARILAAGTAAEIREQLGATPAEVAAR